MRIALYGGTFNPPHMGHILAARSAVQELCPDRLLMIPTAVPPHKEREPGSPPDAERLRLLELLAGDEAKIEVSDIELRRGGLSYTADTISELLELYPGAELFVLMGTDMLESFEKWYEFRYILDNAVLAVFARDGGERGKIERLAESLKTRFGARVKVIPHEPLAISSTELRELLRRRGGTEFLNGAAYAHIIKNRLYDARPELGWLREQARPYLKASRQPHVDGCRDEAVRLAKRWGWDADAAAEAAILHDITKKCSRDEQLLLCAKYAIMTDDAERENEKLLHAKTGAEIARYEFGVPDEIYGAILWHTTGRADMTLLEQIIYIADYIEPTRDFDGVEELRRLAYEKLESAMELGLRMSIEDLRARGIEPHTVSAQALGWFSDRKDMIS